MMFCGHGFSNGRCNEMMESIDFFPTVLKAAGLPATLGEGQVQPALLEQEGEDSEAIAKTPLSGSCLRQRICLFS